LGSVEVSFSGHSNNIECVRIILSLIFASRLTFSFSVLLVFIKVTGTYRRRVC